jgi:condensin-2 complex subunit D3
MVLFGPLFTKQPKLFSNQFVESIFVLNRCTAHPIYQAAAALGDGGSGITVGFEGINVCLGEAGRIRRMSMYQMMLSKMTDEEKIGVCFRIGKEILGGALKPGSTLNLVVCSATPGVNEEDVANESARSVLSDAFAILSSPWIRVGKARDDDDVEDPNISATINSKRAMAVKGLLSNISRKHLIEILLPILCNLKSLLQKSCSPLLRDLMACLLDVYQRYKKEALEVMANDPITLAEIEYDAQQQKKALRRGLTPMRGSVLVATEG